MITLRSRREIRAMRAAGLVVWQAHQAAHACVKPGITTAEINDAVEAVFLAHDAEMLFKGYPGEVPFPAATCISVNEHVVHGVPGDRVLQEGDIVSIDTGCKINGWCGDAAITHPVGEISPADEKLLHVTKRSLDLAIEMMGVKSKWSEVASELQDYVRGEGFSVVESCCGHGIGREMHEDPQAPNYFNPDSFRAKDDFDLKTGLVVAIEPMVNAGGKEVKRLADKWTLATTDGQRSAHFEHTVALTSDGPIRLTGAPEPGEELPA